ncbi:transcriptional regulator, AraC family [Variovorax paradoxus B4]|uniref:Transcriptional regulator, AraC family n=1 Tax=Variovorax paradoxus B4 TaxID=1246301 RepID=T1XI46_VARPD|nr:AraC family transcriptional regulator [Variovorax paradoxus]AGU51815.1 transcriptional regulator, AraC family [Variovorax paradoxus B4]
MDVLSDVLRTIRLEGALFPNGDMHAPWCFKVPRGVHIAQLLKPGAQRLAICHLVLQGECWAQVDGGEPIHVYAGEVIAVPHGDSHVLGSGLHHAAVDVEHVVSPRAPELERIRYGGDGDRTVLVCSWFAYEGDAPNPLMANIPRLFTASLRSRPAGPWIEQSVNFVLGDAASRTPGSEMVAAKVAEVLFAEVLRGYIESMPANSPGWLAGLRDPHVGRCLALMHGEPARNWTVDALADRFAELVGAPPMHYLTRWRMILAAGMLRKDQGNLARIAEGVGYESEAAFNRAFKREYGLSPGAWRQNGARVSMPDETP